MYRLQSFNEPDKHMPSAEGDVVRGVEEVQSPTQGNILHLRGFMQ